MSKSSLSIEQKKSDIDLNIIAVITFVVLGIYIIFNSQIMLFAKNTEIPLLLRTFIIALIQFGVAGLGITIVALYRKESFLSFGLTKQNLIKTILLSILTFVPHIIFRFATSSFIGYLPFQTIFGAKEWYELGFPKNILGITIIATAWGFFEGFNYVVISDKINSRYPSKSFLLDWGAISCGILCLLIHGMIGITPSAFIEALTVFIIIYGMLIIKEYTGNAWGCVFLFMFFWNAL